MDIILLLILINIEILFVSQIKRYLGGTLWNRKWALHKTIVFRIIKGQQKRGVNYVQKDNNFSKKTKLIAWVYFHLMPELV